MLSFVTKIDFYGKQCVIMLEIYSQFQCQHPFLFLVIELIFYLLY